MDMVGGRGWRGSARQALQTYPGIFFDCKCIYGASACGMVSVVVRTCAPNVTLSLQAESVSKLIAGSWKPTHQNVTRESLALADTGNLNDDQLGALGPAENMS